MKIEFKVGDIVRHRHTGRAGSIVRIEPGCNPIFWVLFDGYNYPSPLPLQDIEGLKR